ncbi:MAG: lipoprotein [Actinomycetia bacterium]|nr:lipoprotein [Actinomycetes bacterium]
MNTRTTAALTATALALTLTTACTSTQPKANLGTSPTPSASPSPTGPPDPRFELPNDVKVTISADTTGDSAKDEVLRYNGYHIMAVQEAMAGKGPTDPMLLKYVQDSSAVAHINELKDYKKRGLTLSGEFLFYDRKVTIKSSVLASVLFCEDQRNGYSKELATGKVRLTHPSKTDFIQHSSIVQKGSDGVWREISYLWKRGVEQCVRS